MNNNINCTTLNFQNYIKIFQKNTELSRCFCFGPLRPRYESALNGADGLKVFQKIIHRSYSAKFWAFPL